MCTFGSVAANSWASRSSCVCRVSPGPVCVPASPLVACLARPTRSDATWKSPALAARTSRLTCRESLQSVHLASSIISNY